MARSQKILSKEFYAPTKKKVAKKKATKKKPTQKKAPPKSRAPEVMRKKEPRATIKEDARLMLDSRSPADIKRILREEKKRLLENKKRQLQSARQACRESRAKMRAREKERREELVKRWQEDQERELAAHHERCRNRREWIKATYTADRERVKLLDAELKREKELRAAIKRRHLAPAAVRAAMRKREKQSEDKDHARNEIARVSPRLLPYFDKVKGRLKKRPHMTLVESFLLDAEEHPEEVVIASQRGADREVAQLVREGEDAFRTRHARIEGLICERARRHAKRKGQGPAFQLKASELRALGRIGVDAGRLMNECYNQQLRRRRIVSQRLEDAPF